MIRLRWPWGGRSVGVRVKLEQTKLPPLLGEPGGMVKLGKEPKQVLASRCNQEPCDYPHCETRWKGHCDRSRLEEEGG